MILQKKKKEEKTVTNRPARCRRWSGVVCSDVWLKLSRPWARELGELWGENHGQAEAAKRKNG
jgi:hypothetical protein